MEEKPASQIMPHRNVPDTISGDEIIKTIEAYWSLHGPDNSINYNKGFEIGKGHLHREDDLALALMYGVIKSLFEEVKYQINKDETLNMEKRQRNILRANALQKSMFDQIDILKTLNFKLDVKSLQAILQGYTTSLLLLKR